MATSKKELSKDLMIWLAWWAISAMIMFLSEIPENLVYHQWDFKWAIVWTIKICIVWIGSRRTLKYISKKWWYKR